MVLYAKTLGASATVLGIIAGMTPLLVIFQIPAAHFIPRVGYRRFVYGGWGMRVMFIFIIAVVPLTSSFQSAETRLAIILSLLFGFNLSRGISSAGWLPWMTALVPEDLRGKYLLRDAVAVNLGSGLVLLLAAFVLGRSPEPAHFTIVFAFSALAGAASLAFLKRIPETPVPVERSRSNAPVPWMDMLRFPPFLALLKTVVAWSIAYGGLTTFTVAFLKTEYGLADREILLANSITFLGGLGSIWFLGARLDHFGSKPVLTVSMTVWIVIVAGWALLAGKAGLSGFAFILILQLSMGLFAALVSISNMRLAMATIPVMGRDHFFAMYSFLTNLALGLSPLIWGLMIDFIGTRQIRRFGLEWNRFTCFFAAVILALIVTLCLTRRLHEPKAVSIDLLLKEILLSPRRVFVRLWPRF